MVGDLEMSMNLQEFLSGFVGGTLALGGVGGLASPALGQDGDCVQADVLWSQDRDTQTGYLSVSVDGPLAVTTAYGAEMDIIGVMGAGLPGVLSIYGVEVPGPYRFVYDAHIDGRIAYIAIDGWGFQGILAVDLNDPFSPSAMGALDVGGNRNIQVVGSTLYAQLGNSESGLFRVVDVSDPGAMSVHSEVETDGLIGDMAVVGSMLYISDGNAGMVIYDVSDPAAPALAGSYAAPGFDAQDIEVEDGRAFVLSDGKLTILDVSDPTEPGLLGEFTIPSAADDFFIYGNNLAVDGDDVYVMNGRAELLVLDVSDPGAIDVIGVNASIGLISDIAVQGDELYVVDQSTGLKILNVSNSCEVVCQADMNGDGDLNFFDVSAFLTAYLNRDPAADFAGDGLFDFHDISIFLAFYQAGCP
jgi:hypothetical protein